jgi:hypothetical protein
MHKTHATVGLTALAAAAFMAGRVTTFSPESSALAAPQSRNDPIKDVTQAVKDGTKKLGDAVTGKQDQQVPPEMQKMMEAWAKVGTPGKHHAFLEPAIGTFDAVVRFRMTPESQWIESKGPVKRDWVLGKRFVREVVEATSPMGAYNAIGYLGYNIYDGQYEFVWMDDMATGIFMQYGTYNPDSKIMSLRASHRDPVSGRVINGENTWNLSNPDRQTMEGTMIGEDGKSFKSFEAVFERRK